MRYRSIAPRWARRDDLLAEDLLRSNEESRADISRACMRPYGRPQQPRQMLMFWSISRFIWLPAREGCVCLLEPREIARVRGGRKPGAGPGITVVASPAEFRGLGTIAVGPGTTGVTPGLRIGGGGVCGTSMGGKTGVTGEPGRRAPAASASRGSTRISAAKTMKRRKRAAHISIIRSTPSARGLLSIRNFAAEFNRGELAARQLGMPRITPREPVSFDGGAGIGNFLGQTSDARMSCGPRKSYRSPA